VEVQRPKLTAIETDDSRFREAVKTAGRLPGGCDDYNEIWSRRVAKEYIEERSQGLYVAGTRVSLASVVIQFRQGASPETILQNFPSLVSLENVYGAVAYYLANQREVDQYLKVQELKWAEFRNTADPPPSLGERVEGYVKPH
jgi:uncharacterized protein (DUF433 family)